MSELVNVPKVPGVPPVQRPAGQQEDSLATSDGPSAPNASAAPQWGLFKDGQAVITAEGVSVFDYKKDWNLPTFPQEGGAFQNYDKVELPFDISIKFQAGTSNAARQELLSSCLAIAGTLDLYDAVSPEATYTNVNVDHIDYHRAIDGGLGVVSVEVWVKEIRVTATQSFSQTQTKSPSGASTQSAGTVQPTPADPAQQDAWNSLVQSAQDNPVGNNSGLYLAGH